MDPNQTCPKCNLPILTTFYFCPNCGKQLRPKPLPITVGKQIGIYLLSFFLPPLGLWPGLKYLFQKDAKAKVVGFVAILLTIISMALTFYYAMGFINQFNQQFNPILNQQFK